MTKAHLVPCHSCARHVRVSEDTCIYCDTVLPAELRARPVPRSPKARLGRAALHAVGAGTMTLAAACSSSDTFDTRDPGVLTADAAYGGPPVDAATDAGDANEEPIPTVDAAYGGPPIDANVDDAGDDSGDAANDAPAAAYGAPP